MLVVNMAMKQQDVIAVLEAKGYEFVKVSDLIYDDDFNYKLTDLGKQLMPE